MSFNPRDVHRMRARGRWYAWWNGWQRWPTSGTVQYPYDPSPMSRRAVVTREARR